MGRLFIEYMDTSDENIVVCRLCNVHLIKKNDINPIVGLEVSMCSELPSNVHITPTKENFIAYNPNNYKFNDIICSKCGNDIGWTIDYSTTNQDKSIVFLLNESIKKLIDT